MEKSKDFDFRLLILVLFVSLVLGTFVYIIVEGDLIPAYLSFGSVCACFLFSLIFIQKNLKKIFITCALAVNVTADYFLVFNPDFENAELIGVCLFCGVQLFYLLYTLTLAKGNGIRVVNLAVRVAICLVAYFVIPKYVALSALEMIYILLIINSFITLLTLLIHIKTEWLTFIGFLLFFVCQILVGLANGGAELLGITGGFVDFISTYDIAKYIYIPGILLISLSSVLTKKNKE